MLNNNCYLNQNKQTNQNYNCDAWYLEEGPGVMRIHNYSQRGHFEEVKTG